MEEVVGYLFNLQVQVGPREPEEAAGVGVVTDGAGAPVSVGDKLRAKGLQGPPAPRAVAYAAPDETGQEVRTTEAPPPRSATSDEGTPRARPVPPPRDKARPQAPNRNKKRRRH